MLATERGVLQKLYRDLDGSLVEAGTPLGVIRHYLTRQEVVSKLLKESLYAFCAPERAKYYFVPDVDKKVKILGCRTVSIHDGMELFIVSRMKRRRAPVLQRPLGHHLRRVLRPDPERGRRKPPLSWSARRNSRPPWKTWWPASRANGTKANSPPPEKRMNQRPTAPAAGRFLRERKERQEERKGRKGRKGMRGK